ncbi:MAG TPA: hypothetical protein ENG51_13600 [Deltaproteobacteria bacterium]|nr:hypothetical protein [Deltaproteobacteria bacterium]
MPEKKKSQQEGPEVLAKIGKFEIVMWEAGRYQIRKRVFNPSTQKWETQRLTVNTEEILALAFLVQEVLVNRVRWDMREPAREE